MGKEFGKNWRVKVGDGQATEVCNALGGEVGFSWARSSKEIDTSSKDDGQYATYGFGRQAVTISVNGKLSLPDTAFQRIVDVAKSGTPTVTIQIDRGGITKFQGLMAVSAPSTDHNDDEVVTYKFDLKTAEAPTIDDLGATS